jgi:hypothetical protein
MVSFALASLLVYGAWLWLGNSPTDEVGPRITTSDESLPISEQPADISLPLDGPAAVPVAPGSMQATLLSTTEDSRNQILSLTIRDADFECPSVESAKAVGSNGSVWRVHCGAVLVYWAEVGEFGRLSITPIPYGDFGINGRPGGSPTRIQPETRDDDSFERDQLQLQQQLQQQLRDQQRLRDQLR